MKTDQSKIRETLTDLYYLLRDISVIEERLLNIKKEAGYAIQELVECDLKGKMK